VPEVVDQVILQDRDHQSNEVPVGN
jgi:hypothetical protein